MTPERIEQLRKQYEFWSTGDARDSVITECLDEIERLQAENGDMDEALDAIRDAVLHERCQLEGGWIGSDAVNAVLGIIDDHDPRPLPDAEDEK